MDTLDLTFYEVLVETKCNQVKRGYKKSIKKTIKLLEEMVEDLNETCTFWACEGHTKTIQDMKTCNPCASVIRMKKEIKRLNKLIESNENKL